MTLLSRLRPARDDDAQGLVDLIGAIWRSYPGMVFDVEAELPELLAPASHFDALGGAFWVVDTQDRGALDACVGWIPAGMDSVELVKLYVAGRARRRGLGAGLCAFVADEARARGFHEIELWTDTRFVEAHRLYERLGYVRGRTRRLVDLSSTVEYEYRLALT